MTATTRRRGKVGKMTTAKLLGLVFICWSSSELVTSGSPVPKTQPILSSPSLVAPERLNPPPAQQEGLQLAKPSQLTFKVGRSKCDMDVSLERITCRYLRNRGDLPERQSTFVNVQEGVFLNISGDAGGDIRLEDLKSLFPNLISLTISHSPGSAASLLNLEKTGQAAKWMLKRRPVSESLVDNFFATKFNKNKNNGDTTRSGQPPILAIGDDTPSRGERAVENSENGSRLAGSSEKLFSTEPSTGNGGAVPTSDYVNDKEPETNDIFAPEAPPEGDEDDDVNVQKDDASMPPIPQPPPHPLRRLVWPSVRILNVSYSELTSEALPDFVGTMFPNLEELSLAHNELQTLEQVRAADWTGLQKIDISGNPLDCTTLEWLETAGLTLIQENETTCDQPPHSSNKPKPLLKVLPLLKKVRQECRVNCSCDIAYLWEQNHEVYSKTVVNCSGKGFSDFPNPDHLPRPTDTLDLRNNSITSLASFVDDDRYLQLNVMNLYLDDNQISSINILEGSDWFDQFQVFSLRRNQLSEVPVYVLENAFRTNPRLLQIDLSSNKFKCDCSTVSSFKVFLLKYSNQIGHVDDVRCASTNEQIRYMRMEQWCTVDSSGTHYMDVLDLVSIVLAILIVVVVSKVYYDYWNFKTKGKLPWLVGKM